MNGFGIALTTAAVQVTLATLPAAALVLIAGRRSPRTAAALAGVALGSCVLLTAAAFTPSPRWWSWGELAQPPGVARQESGTTATPSGGDHLPADGWRLSLQRLTQLLPAHDDATRPSRPGWSAWALLTGLFLAGTAAELLRLLLGLRAVASCRQLSRPVHDSDLWQLADELRTALGCRRRVELRASAEVGTAATLGWRRPAILLAEDWPEWTADERRAVLAHELAHVRRRDYLMGLLAVGCRAVHFYHPLVRWLAARLRLHQELTADALAARAVGGRTTYLRALAGMALRQDEFCAAGVARSFLSDRGTLLRRVAMLRVTDDGRPLGRAVRWGMAGLLVLAALGASAVRGPAQAPADEAPRPGAAAAELPPFDLSYIPPNAIGFIAVRPAALLSRPEMKPVAERWRLLFQGVCRLAGLGPDFDIPFDAIEQVVGPMELKVYTVEERKKNPHGEGHAVVLGLAFIRMTRDFDWPAVLKSLAPLAQVTEVKPGVFECRAAAFGPQTLILHAIDRRTLVFSLLPGGAVNRHDENAARWGAAWRAVERAGFVQVFDNRDGRWTDDSLANDADLAPFLAAIGRPAHLALGLHWGEQVAVTCAVDYAEEPADADVTRRAEALRRTLEGPSRERKPADARDKLLSELERELLTSLNVRREGKLVTAEARGAKKWVDLLQALTPGEDAPVKAKVEVREGKP